jgi:hypothetical protein
MYDPRSPPTSIPSHASSLHPEFLALPAQAHQLPSCPFRGTRGTVLRMSRRLPFASTGPAATVVHAMLEGRKNLPCFTTISARTVHTVEGPFGGDLQARPDVRRENERSSQFWPLAWAARGWDDPWWGINAHTIGGS